MRRIYCVVIAVSTFFLCLPVFADKFKLNPHTGKLDIVADLPLICDGEPGIQGPRGFTGYSGAHGLPGPGVPAGGTDGQVLTKKGFSNYSTRWDNPTTTIDWSGITGTLNDSTRPDLFTTFEPKNSNIQAHIGSTNNPHATTADQVLPNQAGNNGKVLGTNGSKATWVTGGSGSGTPDGAHKNVQYNKSGAFGGASFLNYSANAANTSAVVTITGQLVIK